VVGTAAAVVVEEVDAAAVPGEGSQFVASCCDPEFPDLYALRHLNRRLSYYPGKPYGELYELERYPHEFVNRWSDPSLEKEKRGLKDELFDRVLAAHDPLPVREELY